MGRYYIYNVDELYHHGIKGMKWGIRRYQPYSTTGGRRSGASGKEVGLAKRRGAVSSKRKKFSVKKAIRNITGATKKVVKTGSSAYKTGKKIYDEHNEKEKRKIIESGNARTVYENKRKLSNKELDEAINRIKKENDLKELKKSPLRKFVDKGSNAAQDALINSGRDLLTTTITGYGKYKIREGMVKNYGEDAANAFVKYVKNDKKKNNSTKTVTSIHKKYTKTKIGEKEKTIKPGPSLEKKVKVSGVHAKKINNKKKVNAHGVKGMKWGVRSK